MQFIQSDSYTMMYCKYGFTNGRVYIKDSTDGAIYFCDTFLDREELEGGFQVTALRPYTLESNAILVLGLTHYNANHSIILYDIDDVSENEYYMAAALFEINKKCDDAVKVRSTDDIENKVQRLEDRCETTQNSKVYLKVERSEYCDDDKLSTSDVRPSYRNYKKHCESLCK